MATDLETRTEGGELAPARPSLKITGLHIRGLKSIGSLDLPEDGLGWDGPIPDFVMLGGINGSGKTTLLEFLADAFAQMANYQPEHRSFIDVPPTLQAAEAKIDFMYSLPGYGDALIRFLIGNQEFVEKNGIGHWFGFQYPGSELSEKAWFWGVSTPDLNIFVNFGTSSLNPEGMSRLGVMYIPSEGRTLNNPATDYKSIFVGKPPDQYPFVDRWSPTEGGEDSLKLRLQRLRWEYLNAKEEGRGDETNGFEDYSKAFDRFFEGRKRLGWHRAELVVKTKSGAIHDLSKLSSGEKQVILFTGELLHRWRPGSIILIDEPELHLHESYQTKLWESLVHWQKERGGQVIVATQSGHLFRISEPGIKVLLSRRSR